VALSPRQRRTARTDQLTQQHHTTRDPRILINLKRKKGGVAYAEGKTLIMFLEVGAASGIRIRWRSSRPIRSSSRRCGSSAYEGSKMAKYVYGVTNLDLTEGKVPTLLVRVSRDFSSWQ
jgi:hypothetical protein